MFVRSAIYAQGPLTGSVGPMSYTVAVAALWASDTHTGGCTEFDEAAV